MRGITKYAVSDIYDYIENNEESEFLVKFCAMEIYNEAVRDLLSPDSYSLRVLDDPERGTVVEKLTEVTLRNKEHLHELLSICEAQRQIGETSLNETSSRSYQILRLTIESCAREYAGAGNSSILESSVRASQTLTAGARLKEGVTVGEGRREGEDKGREKSIEEELGEMKKQGLGIEIEWGSNYLKEEHVRRTRIIKSPNRLI
ncbi:hypothetical protein F3Y22_tig00117000pilonHSYRG00046 [Hibiscus syriacus]|uniref:Kinesin motor domain-containing protein n=1 Tax=Hibiscus syriacus TaxID=106335 RepID=A0A6A2WDI8_HIBSY|nr:hypothetical protein F3Y22_tig00117000pilonHSYRG00046 [Hibiscus syriacus]